MGNKWFFSLDLFLWVFAIAVFAWHHATGLMILALFLLGLHSMCKAPEPWFGWTMLAAAVVLFVAAIIVLCV